MEKVRSETSSIRFRSKPLLSCWLCNFVISFIKLRFIVRFADLANNVSFSLTNFILRFSDRRNGLSQRYTSLIFKTVFMINDHLKPMK